MRASDINLEMKIAAANAIASLITKDELDEDHVIASPFDPRVAPTVARAVAEAALATGVARRTDVSADDVERHTKELLGESLAAVATA